MGDKVSVPICERTHSILFNEKLAARLDSSDEVITLYKINGKEELEYLNSEETMQALRQVDIVVSRGVKVKASQFALKGFSRAQVAYFA